MGDSTDHDDLLFPNDVFARSRDILDGLKRHALIEGFEEEET